ncbi:MULTISPECIES: hypothetical protein [Fusobacterium]|nr:MULTISPECIES: hypothetical protein [Fusobacterium]
MEYMVMALSGYTKNFEAVENYTVTQLRRYFERLIDYLEERYGS